MEVILLVAVAFICGAVVGYAFRGYITAHLALAKQTAEADADALKQAPQVEAAKVVKEI